MEGGKVCPRKTNKALVRRYVEEFVDHSNFDLSDEIFVPDFVRYDAAPDQVSRVEDLKHFFAMLHSGFPGFRSTIEDLLCEGDKAALGAIQEEWPLMRQVRTSPHAGALAEELRGSIQEGYRTSTGTEQEILGKELDVMDELDEDRADRLIAMRQRLPSILWAALIVLAIAIIGLSPLVGMKSHRVHMLSVGALAVGITLVLFTVGVLDRPFGTDFGLKPQPFELVLNDIGGTQGR